MLGVLILLAGYGILMLRREIKDIKEIYENWINSTGKSYEDSNKEQ
jgi:hypothetical protein